ncbi:hypothetical protein BKA59DRAFT_513076 [Fusarium tricinctum]|uniref:BTB domain-containing protein n=1 Tax=Fusarium tricinctum TaxID=61284 RepID=A0A8K0RTF9_9HYPO|nr:hypothetical protein BKA59DRAFT_513076 [Fusarium tricinctum]
MSQESPQTNSTEEKDQDDTSPWVVILGGNIMLIVGQDEMEIQAGSEFLGHISPFFRAMFSSNMEEGQALRDNTGSNSVPIKLPVDDPEAVYFGLQALYGADPESFNIPARTIRDISIFADKYDMTTRFLPMATLWLAAAPLTMDLPDRQAGWDLLVASYWFGLAKPFYIMSQFLLGTNIPLLEYALGLEDQNLGLRLALAIEQVRLANVYRGDEIGLCLDCFRTARTCDVQRQPGCRYEGRHLW